MQEAYKEDRANLSYSLVSSWFLYFSLLDFWDGIEFFISMLIFFLLQSN